MANNPMPEMRDPVPSAPRVMAPASDSSTVEYAPAEHGYWLEFQERVAEQSLAACMRAADAILKLTALLVPAYIAVASIRKFEIQRVPIGLWVCSSLCALVVLLPRDWTFRPNDVENIRRNFWRLVRHKRHWSLAAAVLAVAGIFFAFLWPGVP